jgi:hypothetical protein
MSYPKSVTYVKNGPDKAIMAIINERKPLRSTLDFVLSVTCGGTLSGLHFKTSA